MKEATVERRQGIVTLLGRKELMSSANIGEQLGIEKVVLFRDLKALLAEKVIAKEGASRSTKYRLASKTRKSNGNGHAPKEPPAKIPALPDEPDDVSAPPAKAAPLVDQLMAAAAKKRGELAGLEEAIVIAMRAS